MLLIEQNLGVAIEVADTIDVMVNGRIARSMPAAELAADRELQQRLLGVKMAEDEVVRIADEAPAAEQVQILTVKRAGDELVPPDDGERTLGGTTRWGSSSKGDSSSPEKSPKPASSSSRSRRPRAARRTSPEPSTRKGASSSTCKSCLEKLGLRTVTVDLATSGKPSSANIHPREVARHHPKGERAVFTGDRGSAVSEMGVAFENFVAQRRDLGGLISAGGSGGTALATQAMRRLPIGIPKVMVSTVASGDVKPYVGPSDICMMYSVTDISGINRISEKVLANAAHALAGMIAYAKKEQEQTKPALGLTMFGLTTPCVQAVCKQLEERYDCIVFHATGTGGQSMEKLVDSGLIAGVLDVTTTEIADELVGGVLTAGPTRMDVFARKPIPYVGSCGALDMVNFWAMDTVPAQFKQTESLPAQQQRDADAHHARRNGAHRPLHRREAEPHAGPGALPDPGRRRLGHRRAGQALLGPGGGQDALFDTIAIEFPPDGKPKARPLPAPHQRPGVRRSAGRQLQRDRANPMARIARQDILKKLHAQARRGEPIVGGGAGTGLSAKCEEAGGIDLIVIYNSGRYRMAGRGSLAGLMAYGNANEIVLDMAREVLPVVKHTPVLAGVNGTDPFLLVDSFLEKALRAGLLRDPELPDGRACSTARSAPSSRKPAWATGWKSK